MNRFKLTLVVALLQTLLATNGFAQSDEEQAAETAKAKTLLAEAESILDGQRFFRKRFAGFKQVNVPIKKKPIFRHHDAVRGEKGGAIWLIGKKGRPLGVTVLYTFDTQNRWVQSVRSLSTTKAIGAELKQGGTWNPNQPGVKFRPLKDAPTPKASRYLSQAKQQARRFSGHEIIRDGRTALRLLSKELHTYQDKDNGIAFGALFALAHNTNPEVYLLLEIRERDGKRSWEYALAEFTWAEVYVKLDKTEVWSNPLISSSNARNPYYLFNQPKKSGIDPPQNDAIPQRNNQLTSRGQ